MSKPIITKRNWVTYRACQRIGFFNMLDYEGWSNLWNKLPRIEWPFGKLTRDEWFEILNNYSHYKELFNNENDDKETCPNCGTDLDDFQNP